MPPTQMLRHLGNLKHRKARINIDQQEYNKAIQLTGVTAQLSSPPMNDNLPPVYGLSLHSGIYCSHCDHTTQTALSMKLHQRTIHDEIPVTERSYTHGGIQRLNASNHKSWFRIQSPPNNIPVPTQDDNPFFTEAKAIITNLSTTISTADNLHNLSPWLRQCGWNEYTDNSDVADIRAQVAMPNDEDFPFLAKYVEIYMQNADGYIDSTHCLILNKLGTDNDV